MKSGGPTVRWHLIQPIVEAAECDVLIILDCCFGGQAARGRASHKIELLAAAAMGLRTPGVGQRLPSFTAVLMQEMERLLHERKSFEVTTLYQRLLRKENKLEQQPFYAPLAGSSIVLRKLEHDNDTGVRSITSDTPSICIDISLFEQPSEAQRRRILQWLTISSPKDVSAIDVVDVYKTAQSTMHIGQKVYEAFTNDETLHPTLIPNPAKESLIQQFENLILAVDRPIPALGLNEGFVIEIIGELKRKSQDFLESIEDCIAGTSLDQLQKLAFDEHSRTSGLADRISIRLKLLKDLPSKNESYEEKRVRFETLSRDRERFRRGKVGETSLLVEYYYPDPASRRSENSYRSLAASEMMEAKKVAALLAEPKDKTFCTLNGRGVVQEQLHQVRLGFIYAIPDQYVSSSYMLLAACFLKHPNVPLEVRVRMAQRLTAAVISLHAIGWLHKSIKGDNVLVFDDSKAVDPEISLPVMPSCLPDLENPFLLGFDCSRPTDAESFLQASWNTEKNLYRHPKRWGRPVKFTKMHDIYALVRSSFLSFMSSDSWLRFFLTGHSPSGNRILASNPGLGSR